MAEDLFSASAPAQRIAVLLDSGSSASGQMQAHGSLVAATGSIGARQVTVIATDRQVALPLSAIPSTHKTSIPVTLKFGGLSFTPGRVNSTFLLLIVDLILVFHRASMQP